jgi:hypothetical protein
MKISGNAIPDPEKLASEITAETARMKKEGKIPERDERLERAVAAFAAGKEEKSLLALARASSGIFGAERLARKAGPAAPLIRAGVKILARLFRDQEIFNSLVLEVLEEQEKKIALLEKKER